MTITAFILTIPEERQALITKLHEIIISKDKTVTPVIAPMMGKEMIIYNAHETFKYGLASAKNHLSLHVLPMYMNPPIYEKYKALLPDAVFQKGCINFKSADEVPFKIIKELITECSKINLKEIRDKMLAAKAKKK